MDIEHRKQITNTETGKKKNNWQNPKYKALENSWTPRCRSDFCVLIFEALFVMVAQLLLHLAKFGLNAAVLSALLGCSKIENRLIDPYWCI